MAEKRKAGKVRIEGIDGTANWKIWLDDEEISHLVTGLDLHLDIHDVPRLDLRMVMHHGLAFSGPLEVGVKEV